MYTFEDKVALALYDEYSLLAFSGWILSAWNYTCWRGYSKRILMSAMMSLRETPGIFEIEFIMKIAYTADDHKSKTLLL